MACAAAGSQLLYDKKNNIFSCDRNASDTGDPNAHILELLVSKRRSSQIMINIGRSDAIGNSTKCTVHSGMAVSGADQHSGKDFSAFYHHDMLNTLLGISVVENFKIKVRAVLYQVLDLCTGIFFCREFRSVRCAGIHMINRA